MYVYGVDNDVFYLNTFVCVRNLISNECSFCLQKDFCYCVYNYCLCKLTSSSSLLSALLFVLCCPRSIHTCTCTLKIGFIVKYIVHVILILLTDKYLRLAGIFSQGYGHLILTKNNKLIIGITLFFLLNRLMKSMTYLIYRKGIKSKLNRQL